MIFGLGGYWYAFNENLDGTVNYTFFYLNREIAEGFAYTLESMNMLFDIIVAMNLTCDGDA